MVGFLFVFSSLQVPTGIVAFLGTQSIIILTNVFSLRGESFKLIVDFVSN